MSRTCTGRKVERKGYCARTVTIRLFRLKVTVWDVLIGKK